MVLAAAASFLPGVPRLELDPELILAIVIPPLLVARHLIEDIDLRRAARHTGEATAP